MSEELLQEPKPDFHVKLQSDTETPSAMGEPRVLSQEVSLLRAQVQQLCAAVRALTQLQSILNQAVQQLLKGSGANFEVI